MLVAGLTKELINAVYSAKVFRPDGIVSSKDTWDLITAVDNEETADYPFDDLNTITGGLKKGALVTVCAGSGIGKSLFCKEVAYSLLQQGKKVGYIALEESVKRTMQGLMSIRLNKPLHLNHTLVDAAELKAAWEEVASDNLYLYDHFGSTDSDNLLNRIRYMNKALGCDYIFLDHLSIVVSGASASLDERRLIDSTMTNLRTLVEETGISLTIVSHLKRIEGNRGHEDGVAVSLGHLRGSQAIAQLSDQVLALSRSTTSDTKDLTTLSVLKNRYSGETGEAATLKYDPTTGRLKQTDPLEAAPSESISF
jgi:twinkle protein